MHSNTWGDWAAWRQMKLNSNKHKVMCIGKSNLRSECTSVHSKFAAASEEANLGIAHNGWSGQSSQGCPGVTTPWQGKSDLILYRLHQWPKLDRVAWFCYRFHSVTLSFHMWEDNKKWLPGARLWGQEAMRCSWWGKLKYVSVFVYFYHWLPNPGRGRVICTCWLTRRAMLRWRASFQITALPDFRQLSNLLHKNYWKAVFWCAIQGV